MKNSKLIKVNYVFEDKLYESILTVYPTTRFENSFPSDKYTIVSIEELLRNNINNK